MSFTLLGYRFPVRIQVLGSRSVFGPVSRGAAVPNRRRTNTNMHTNLERGTEKGERYNSLMPILDQERSASFTTISGRPIERLYTPENIAWLDYARDLGHPGEFPYTRGIHAKGYRGKLWTMRQFAGFGTPEDTNARYKQLLAAGGTGLSVAFDLPTLMGRDPDHELSLGEVGKCGVNVTSLADMETLFNG